MGGAERRKRNQDKRSFKQPAKSCLTLATPWTEACQAPRSMGFSRQEYCSGLPFPSPRDLPDPGIEPRSSALQANSLPTELWGKPKQPAVESDLKKWHWKEKEPWETLKKIGSPTVVPRCCRNNCSINQMQRKVFYPWVELHIDKVANRLTAFPTF